MKTPLKKAAFTLFIISLFYYVFWLGYSFYLYFNGIESGWLIPSLSSHQMNYGWDAFSDRMGMSLIYTVYLFWFIPLYQHLYLIVTLIIKIKNKIKKAK